MIFGSWSFAAQNRLPAVLEKSWVTPDFSRTSSANAACCFSVHCCHGALNDAWSLLCFLLSLCSPPLSSKWISRSDNRVTKAKSSARRFIKHHITSIKSPASLFSAASCSHIYRPLLLLHEWDWLVFWLHILRFSYRGQGWRDFLPELKWDACCDRTAG